MPWSTNVAVTLQAGDTIINPNGNFVYSAAPAAGDLIASIAPAAGTDTFGNAYEQGIVGYAVIAGNTYGLRLGLATVNGSPTPAFFLDHVSGPLTAPNQSPAYSFGNADSTGTGAIMYSGKALAGSSACYIECADSTLSGQPGGEIVVNGGLIAITGTVTINGSSNTGSAGLTDGTINGSSSTAGLTNGTINGTSGAASAGTAHTHGGGSYAVNNGQHSHASGTYAVANGSHNHAL